VLATYCDSDWAGHVQHHYRVATCQSSGQWHHSCVVFTNLSKLFAKHCQTNASTRCRRVLAAMQVPCYQSSPLSLLGQPCHTSQNLQICQSSTMPCTTIVSPSRSYGTATLRVPPQHHHDLNQLTPSQSRLPAPCQHKVPKSSSMDSNPVSSPESVMSCKAKDASKEVVVVYHAH
jgi:hypothetical protein